MRAAALRLDADTADLARRIEARLAFVPPEVGEALARVRGHLVAGDLRAAGEAWPARYPAVSVQVLGAARRVTGSMHLVRAPGGNVLVDAGLAQGNPEEAERLNRRALAFDPAEIDVLVITHGHIDHMGLVPRLVREGFRGEILATPVTAALMEISLGDSARLQWNRAARERGFDMRKRRDRDRITPQDVARIREEVLYDEDHVKATMARIRPLELGVLDRPREGVRVRLAEAGHLPGSAAVELWVEGPGRTHKVVFGGDTGNIPYPLLPRPASIEGADVLLLESTYGDRHHDAADLEERYARFVEAVTAARADGGHILMPAFAIGRSQVILSWLARMKAEGSLPREVPLVLDGRMAASALKVLREHPESLDRAQTGHLTDSQGRFFWIPGFQLGLRRNQELRPGSIVIASSGMLTGGKAIPHSQALAPHPENDLIFSGYAAPGTPARRIMDGESPVRIGGREVEVRARVHRLSGFSGHADQGMLLEYVRAFDPRPGRVLLVHGEPAPAETLRGLMESELGIPASVPARGEVLVLE